MLQKHHGAIHDAIFADVRANAVGEALVSTLLNVNRELMNCQLWLVLALGSYHLAKEQAEDLEQVPIA